MCVLDASCTPLFATTPVVLSQWFLLLLRYPWLEQMTCMTGCVTDLPPLHCCPRSYTISVASLVMYLHDIASSSFSWSCLTNGLSHCLLCLESCLYQRIHFCQRWSFRHAYSARKRPPTAYFSKLAYVPTKTGRIACDTPFLGGDLC